MNSRLKTGLLAVGTAIAFLSLSFLLDRIEAAGCDIGENGWECAVHHAWGAVHNWMYADDYRYLLIGGPAHESFMSEIKTTCIKEQAQQHTATNKTNEQIAIFCGCYAVILTTLAVPTDLRYLARHQKPPPWLQREIDDREPDCAALADSVGAK
jgi:hypothetical protein